MRLLSLSFIVFGWDYPTQAFRLHPGRRDPIVGLEKWGGRKRYVQLSDANVSLTTLESVFTRVASD